MYFFTQFLGVHPENKNFRMNAFSYQLSAVSKTLGRELAKLKAGKGMVGYQYCQLPVKRM